MTKLEKTEILLIPFIGWLVWQLNMSNSLELTRIVLYASALLLLQGLIRDITLLMISKPNANEETIQATCLCVESSIGMTGIIAGAVLIGIGFDSTLNMSPLKWSMGIMGVLVIGFLIKDFVIQAIPLRIYRDKDHMNIVFTWKK